MRHRGNHHPSTPIIVALAVALVFGVVLLAGGDWVPGGIIVLAALIGLSAQLSLVRRSHGEPPVGRTGSSA